ncbi:MAG: 3-oxoacyl-ACP synthase III family protein [Bdellovibrionota bacterium]
MKVLKPNLIVKVEGVGRSWPDGAPLSNAELLKHHPETSDKPEALLQELGKRVARAYGFELRYMTRKPWDKANHKNEESSESLSKKAVAQLLEKNPGFKPEAFLLGSTTTRRYTGSQATSVLANFGLEIPAYELKAGCSTSLATLHLSQALLAQGYESVLVSCAETLSKVVHPGVRDTWFGLADAGAAVGLRKVTERSSGDFEILKSVYSTDGTLVDLYTTPGDLPPTAQELAENGFSLTGDASQLKDHAKKRYLEMIEAMLPSKADRESVNWIICHQVNRMLTDEVIKETGLAGELIWDADKFGNLGGTSVLFSLAHAIEQKRFNKGDKIFFMSVGGGLSFAAQLWQKL